MYAVVRLLGPPGIDDGGVRAPAPPRGQKTWGLLAYLVLAEQLPSHQRLSEMLFAAAADPLGALRWCLSDLRRGFAPHVEVSGDPVHLRLRPGVDVDVHLLARGDLPLLGAPGGELLEGMTFDRSPIFDAWLQIERIRLGSAVNDLLRERALRHLGAGDTARALTAATDLMARDPLDEANQVLLVRILAMSGSHQGALDQVERGTRLFRSELGIEPSPALRAAAGVRPRPRRAATASGRAAAAAQLEAGQAAVNAGAVETGLQCLQQAVAQADQAHASELRLESLIALGSALVHRVRGRDEEGAATLHQALVAAQTAGDERSAGRVYRELGFIDVQAGRRDRAEQWLARAESLVRTDAELAAVLGNRGMNQSDMASYPLALATLEQSVERAVAGRSVRQAAWSLALIGRVHLLRGSSAAAVHALERSLALVHDAAWTAFAPWPESLRAEVDRSEGDFDKAQMRYDHAFALACQIEDPCWEGIAGRGLGLLKADSGDIHDAIGSLNDAENRCLRWPDSYQWVRAYVRDAICEVAVTAGHPEADQWVSGLMEVAARGSMREFTVRSLRHRARLGHPGAATAAEQAAAEVDNPLLADLVGALR